MTGPRAVRSKVRGTRSGWSFLRRGWVRHARGRDHAVRRRLVREISACRWRKSGIREPLLHSVDIAVTKMLTGRAVIHDRVLRKPICDGRSKNPQLRAF